MFTDSYTLPCPHSPHSLSFAISFSLHCKSSLEFCRLPNSNSCSYKQTPCMKSSTSSSSSCCSRILPHSRRGGFHGRTLKTATTIGCSRIPRQSGKRRIPFQNVAVGNNNRLLDDSSAIRKEEDSISERCRRQQQSAARRFLSNPEEENSISERCRWQQQSAARGFFGSPEEEDSISERCR